MNYSRACLAAISIVAITAASGCEAMPLYRVRGHQRACPPEYMGIDDVDFHGHSKTCWRTWDNPAWSTIECPIGSDVYLSSEVQSRSSAVSGRDSGMMQAD